MPDEPHPTGPDETRRADTMPVRPNAPVAAGRYVLGDEIARGGMGAVYRATDTVLRREVAVKLLHEKYATASAAARRFDDEARITAQLQHPAIPPVHHLGTLPDGRPFLAMKLIKGHTLDAQLKDRPDPAHGRGRFVAAFEQVCQAVAFAHDRKVIHRDLKPANVMVGSFGEVQVMDWGLAKVLTGHAPEATAGDPEATAPGTAIRTARDDDGPFTQAGSVLGTPAFMSPEQAIGAVDQIDERSDVFGLGAVLAVVLSGRPPFVADSAESTRQAAAKGRVGECFARLDACGADPELVALCKRCLAPEKADRPANAGAVATAVAALRAAADERARQAERDRVRAEAEAREQRKRRKVQLALAGVAGLLLVTGGAFAWYAVWQAGERKAERERADGDKRTADREEEFKEQRRVVEQQDRYGRTGAGVADLLAQCEAALRADDPDRARLALDAAEKRAAEGGAEHLADRLARARGDLKVLAELDHLDNLYWAVTDGVDQYTKARAERPGVFRAFGVVPGETPTDEAARRVTASAVRDRLIAHLDVWHAANCTPALVPLLWAVDPDPYRTEVRAVIAAGGAGIRPLLDRPEALAQPPRFAAILGQMDRGAPNSNRILVTAHHRFPGDFALLMALGVSLPSGVPETAAERGRWYQAAVAVRPRNPVAWNSLGVAHLDRGEPAAAQRCFDGALRCDPAFNVARYNRGLAKQRTGDPVGAVADFREAARLDPTYASAHYNLGVALINTNDLRGAETGFRAAIAANPRHAAAHGNLAVVLQRNGNLPAAEEMVRKSLDLDKTSPQAWLTLGLVLKARDDLPAAEAALRESIRIDPKAASPHHALANILVNRKEWPEAIAEFELAIKLGPTYYGVWHDAGLAYLAAGNSARAEACWRETVRLNPTYASGYTNLAAVLLDRDELDEARVRVTEAARLDPADPYAKRLRDAVAARIATRDKDRTAPPPREVKR